MAGGRQLLGAAGGRPEVSWHKGLTSHGPSLVVEVAEDDVDALVLLAEQVLDGHLDVVKGDEAGAGGGRVGRLDGLGLDAVAAGDEEHAEGIGGADAGDEVVAPGAVCDPLFGAVDDLTGLRVSGTAGREADGGRT